MSAMAFQITGLTIFLLNRLLKARIKENIKAIYLIYQRDTICQVFCIRHSIHALFMEVLKGAGLNMVYLNCQEDRSTAHHNYA